MQNEKKQHKVFVTGFSLIALVIIGFLLKPVVLNWKDKQKNQNERKANEEILKAPSVMPEDLFKKIRDKSKIFLVDISSPDDFSRGHIAAAANVSADEITKEYLALLGADRTADVFIMNQGGDLTDLATLVNKLISGGFANAKYLRGGIPGWREKGFPLVSSGGSDADGAKVKKITLEEIRKEAGMNPALLQFLDVRGKDAYAAEHIFQAVNVPLSELEGEYDEVPAVKKVIVYGADENESFQAAVILFDLNFFNVWQMDGGIEDWKAAGGNTTNSD